MKRWMILLATGATMLGISASAARACPMCKDSISDTAKDGSSNGRGPQSGLPSGFNSSVYLMLVGFLGTAGLITGIVTRGILGANAAQRRRGFAVASDETPPSD